MIDHNQLKVRTTDVIIHGKLRDNDPNTNKLVPFCRIVDNLECVIELHIYTHMNRYYISIFKQHLHAKYLVEVPCKKICIRIHDSAIYDWRRCVFCFKIKIEDIWIVISDKVFISYKPQFHRAKCSHHIHKVLGTSDYRFFCWHEEGGG